MGTFFVILGHFVKWSFLVIEKYRFYLNAADRIKEKMQTITLYKLIQFPYLQHGFSVLIYIKNKLCTHSL